MKNRNADVIRITPNIKATDVEQDQEREIGIGSLKLSAKAKAYVGEVLDSNRLSYGPFTRRFETLFAEMHGVDYAVASSSGTAALQIALDALKEIHRWKVGDEVIVPATTFIATSNTVIHAQLKPVFVDVDPVHYCIDPSKIKSKITKRTRAILPVHLLGQPADMNPIKELAHQYKLRVIEDSAETMLATYKGRSVGSIGDIGCFSTYVAHLLTTGVGGINTTNDPDVAVTLRSLINHGRDSIYLNIDDDDTRRSNFEMIVKKRFSFVRLGYSDRTTELNSAIGLAQLEEGFHVSIEKRQANAQTLTELLKPLEEHLQLPSVRPGNTHSFMIYPIVLKRHARKEKLVQHLERKGIETRDLMPLINQPIYKKLFNLQPRSFPVSNWLLESGFYIGCHNLLTQSHLEYIASAVCSFFKARHK
jgi:perosamine synthetase